MTTIARWLPLLAIACTGSVEDDSEPTGTDDSDSPTDDTDDSATGDDSNVTKGDRWDGTYTGAWSLVFDWDGKVEPSGTCNGPVVLTVAGEDISAEISTSGCDGLGLTFYGTAPGVSLTEGEIIPNPESPTNTGEAHLELVGKKETCSFDFPWTFADNHDPTQVAAEHTLRSEDQFKKKFCAGAGYTFNFLAQIPKKD